SYRIGRRGFGAPGASAAGEVGAGTRRIRAIRMADTANDTASSQNGSDRVAGNAAANRRLPSGGPMNCCVTVSVAYWRPFAASRCSEPTTVGNIDCAALEKTVSAAPSANDVT